MKKYFLFALIMMISSISTLSHAQKKDLSFSDYLNPEIYPERISGFSWLEGDAAFSFIEKNQVMIQQVGEEKANPFLTTDDFSAALTQSGFDSIKRIPAISWIDKENFVFTHKHKILNFNTTNNTTTILNSYTQEAQNVDVHKTTHRVAFTKEQNLFIADNQKEIQITTDTKEGVVNGTSVHRSEFGIYKGTFWSNTGRYLAFYHKDESMVTNYPLVDVSARVAQIENIRYPMAGMTSHVVKIGIYDVETGETVFLNTQGADDDYYATITWGPEDKFIYVSELNREQNHLKLNQFSTDGAYVKTLFEETNERYVEPEHDLHFIPGQNDQFIWFSERDGFQHMYLYTTEGKLIKQVTQGEWIVQEIESFDAKGQNILFYATKNSPLNHDLFNVNIKSGKISQISEEKGTHYASLSPDKKYILDIYTSLEMGRQYRILSQKGKTEQILLTDKDPMENFNRGEMIVDKLQAEDGVDLYYRIIKPVDFDTKKKYPVLVYVYGGPHAQLITNSYGASAGLFLEYMASQGYVVFTLDNRGSANRGFEFESIIHRNVGEREMKDQMIGIDFLKTLDYVDTDRIGVDGWSYGGFMTINLMLTYPETFKVACAGGPVIDWKYYEVMYGERYMDQPQTNPEGYKNSSLLHKVENLEGRLMIIHGTNDPTVVWQHSQDFVKECVEQGKLLDYFIYPGHGHNVRGKDRIHLFKKIEQYFNDHL